MLIFALFQVFCFQKAADLCPDVETLSCTTAVENFYHTMLLTIKGHGTLTKLEPCDYESLTIEAEDGDIIIPKGTFTNLNFKLITLRGVISFLDESTLKASQTASVTVYGADSAKTYDYHIESSDFILRFETESDITLSQNAFPNLIFTKVLHLTSSPDEYIVKIPQVFGEQPYLQEVDFYDHNNITFTENPFLSAPNLYKLRGANTLGKDIPFGDSIKYYKSFMSHGFNILNSSIIRSLTNLEILDLEIEVKTTFPSNELSKFTKLKEIILQFEVEGSTSIMEENAIPSFVKKFTLTTSYHINPSFYKNLASVEELTLNGGTQKITNQLDVCTSLKSLTISNCNLTSTTFKALQNLESLTLDFSGGLSRLNFDESVKEDTYIDSHINNITFITRNNEIDIEQYCKYFATENIQVLRLKGTLFTIDSVMELPNLRSIGIPEGTQIKTASLSKRALKSTIANLNFDNNKITSITYFNGEAKNDYETMKEFPNVKNITLDSIQTISDNIIKDFTGTLTIPTSLIVDKAFIDKVNKQEITIVANEYNDNFNFADGIFYESGFTAITGIVPQCETVVIREGIKNIDKDLFSNNKKLKSITLPSTIETIEEGAFTGCESLSYVRCESDSVKADGSIFDDSSKVTVSVPPTYKDDSLGGASVTKEDLNEPTQPDLNEPTQPDPSSPNQPDNVGLIVGVVIAVVVVIVVIVVCVIFFIRKRNQKETAPGESTNNSPEA